MQGDLTWEHVFLNLRPVLEVAVEAAPASVEHLSRNVLSGSQRTPALPSWRMRPNADGGAGFADRLQDDLPDYASSWQATQGAGINREKGVRPS